MNHINQGLIRSTASRDEKNTFSTDSINFPNKAEVLEKKHIHDEEYTDLLKKTLSPSSSAESSLKRDFYCNEKYFSGNECSHQPSEEITSDMRKIKPSLENTGSDELVQLHVSNKEVLDDDANPAEKRSRVQISCCSSDQLMRDNLTKKDEGAAMKIKMKDWECLRRDFHSDFHLEESIEKGTSKKGYGNGKSEEQRIHLGVNEEQSKNFQSILYDQEKISLSEINVKEIGASSRELTVLQSKDTTPNQAIRADLFQSPRRNLRWNKAVLTTKELDLSTSKGTTSGETPGQVCSPRNGNILRNDHLFQVEEGNLGSINPEYLNKNKQQKQLWNFLESQGKARESKTNTVQQIKEHADCEDMWEKRDNTRSFTATPTEKLFTCQETVSYEPSSLADHDITEKVEAGTAYIIKTISESTLESMCAREKAMIAQLPQETAQSGRPIEVKEIAFDPHQGRNDDSHYTFCQGDTVGVIYDNDFEKQSHLGIYKAHVDEIESEETISKYNPAKTHDRKKLGTGNITSVEEPLQVIRSNQKTASKLNLHLGMLPKDKNIFPENRDHGQVQELSKEMDIGAIIHSALNSDTNKVSENGSHVSNHHAKTSVSSHEQAIAVDNTVTTMSLQSEYNCNPASEIQGIEKYLHPGDTTEEVSKSSGIVRSVSRRERHIGQIFQEGESNVKKCLGPTILITEAVENIEKAWHKNEGLLNSGQSPCFSGDKESESSASANLPAHESQAQSNESLLLKYTNSKIPYFLLFLIFLVTIYQYDLMIGLAFYLFSLYWLSWKGGRQKESVRKK
ncbi:PREDICTED: protein phosphatase 1 regulatory subunit 3A [Miniopterus natalensis]|uniref:protein phosphatase 1 regulatory subunit 3A n=1 Tax=Miniopterus natalensis TaxID=291302 RepID=UPI0007A6D61C|nr:PREDICTED: protein phosphatase 1 regulatory subunit 3A [Miniopterus natalensis]